MGLRSKLLGIVLADLPASDSVIDQSSSRFDELMGGKIAPGKWGRFETGYGTTCAVTVVGWLLEAGAPPDMLNAPAPGGSGFTPGAHFTRLNDGAKTRGWYQTPTHGQLPTFRPGDLYEINHGDGNNSHIGVILSVTPSADGQSLTVETADGGQGTRDDQKIMRQTRTFSIGKGAHAVDVSSQYSTGWLDCWISVGGDEALDADVTPAVPSTPSNSDDSDTPTIDDGSGGAPAAVDDGGDDSTGLAAAALVLGVGLLLGAAGWFTYHRPSSGLHALTRATDRATDDRWLEIDL